MIRKPATNEDTSTRARTAIINRDFTNTHSLHYDKFYVFYRQIIKGILTNSGQTGEKYVPYSDTGPLSRNLAKSVVNHS